MFRHLSTVILFTQIWINLHSCADALIASNPLRGYHGAPIIDPHDSVIIDVNGNRVIECKGKKEVTWISELINNNVNNVKITHFLHESSADESIFFTNDQNNYRSNLELSDVTVDFVGFYYCVFNDSIHDDGNTDYEEEVIDYRASSIYVFVNDPDNLLYRNNVAQVFGYQFQPFVIPCKPTSPQVKVELIREDGEAHYVGSYDPKIGYTVSFSDIEQSGYFDCIVQGDPNDFTQYHVMINEQPLTAYLKKPFIISDSNNFAKEGAPFSLTCHAEVANENPYIIEFILPNGKRALEQDFVIVSEIEHEHDNRRKSHVNLTIENSVKSRDEGDYKCTVMDFFNNTNSADVQITFVDKAFVELKAANQNITTNKGRKQAQFLIDYIAYPKARFEWHDPHNNLIINNDHVLNREKYEIEISRHQIKFKIKFPEVKDYGNYTLTAYSDDEVFKQTVSLVVGEKPTCNLDDVYIQQGQEVNMTCECYAYPTAEITWSFQPCQDLSLWPECRRTNTRTQHIKAEKYQMLDIGLDDENEENNAPSGTTHDSEIYQKSEIRFTPTQPGSVRCKAKNKHGGDSVEGRVKIGDLAEPFLISGLSDDHQIAVGDFVKLECGAIIYNYTNTINWTRNGDPIESSDGIEIQENHTQFSWRKSIIFHEITKENAGEYHCEVFDKITDEAKVAYAIVEVHDAHAPQIITNFNQSTITLPLGGSLNLECYISGLPVPQLKWNKNGEYFAVDENDPRISLINNGMTLVFAVSKPEDSGTYECIAENRIAAESKSVDVVVTTPSGQINRAIVIGVITIILILVLLSLYLLLKVRIKKRQIAMLKAAGLANFEEGQIDSIDPDVNLDEQADLLPYDKKFEFPREKLKLGKQLGAGAFGVVVKATAEGILHYEDESIVAVKMVKKQTDNEIMKSLVSELKIMIHLGQHLNVVNLLGAVTKNIAKRELMVIVEYCRFGNIQSFLVKHRPYFIDQVRSDKIDPMIMKNEMRWSKNSAYNSYNSQGLKYISVAFASDKVLPKEHSYINNINGNRYINFSEGNQYMPQSEHHMGVSNPGAHMNTHGYVRHSGFHQIDSCNTEATVVSSMTEPGEDSAMLSNNSEQPLWRTNYGMDYKGPARSVCTSDLVCWAFQVARGMEYLASRKVLHGDLAARNILLCDDNIVKICDFGLARSMYKSDNYKKKGEAPLPFKWLSLEAISDHVFSTYSDVWAFGIVLWEFFTLGKVPYTGMEANQELFYKLRDGYRMEKPKYATEDIYDIMLACWNAKPESRPLFNQLERKLSAFLMDSVKDHYLDLNAPYLQANIKNYESGLPVYLTSLSIPEGDAPTPPLAEQELFTVNNSTTDVPSTHDYLSMSPKSGVVKYNSQKPESPTITKNLDTSPKNKKNINKRPELPEEIPMLASNVNGNGLSNFSDEDEPQNGYTEMSFSNKKKRKAPQPPTTEASSSSDPEYKNIFNTNENYVNVPAINKNSSIANPSYITFQSVNERA